MPRLLWLVVPLIAVIGCQTPSRLRDDPKPVYLPTPRAEFRLTEDEQAILDATNAERIKVNLEPLVSDPKLFVAARSHADNMASQNSLKHELDGRDVADRVKAAGYNFRRVGENIAWNQGSPQEAVTGWMDSKGHRQNLLSAEYTHVGVAVAKNKKGEPYWVQVFGSPRGE